MKIALVHDYIKEYGGAERVLEELHEIWPEAPVYTSVYLPKYLGPHKERFKNWNIKTSFLQYLPFKAKLISPFRLIAPFVFKSFDLSKFDVIIVSATGAYTSNSIQCHPELVSGPNSSGNEMPKRVRNDTMKRPVHVCYCHTPPRYLYGFATARNLNKSIILGSIGKVFNHFLRLVDFKAARNVDYFIANSQNVKERIKKFYRRESKVIYPPVQGSLSQFADSSTPRLSQPLNLAQGNFSKSGAFVARFKSSAHSQARPSGEYFLAGGRLARPKHIDLIIKACQELKMPLKIFGRGFGGYGEELNQELGIMNYESEKNRIHNSKIEFVGEVTDEEKFELMRNAKAYIFAAEDEDFGITPVEAMSVGTPVIAYRSGGVVESVVDGKTGLFFDDLTVEGLSKAIEQLNNLTIDFNDCIKQSQKFSKERFKREIKEFVNNKLR